MKRALPLLLALLLLAGCRGQTFYPDEYSYVNEHQAPYAVRETTAEPTETETETEPEMPIVSSPYQIRDGIVDLILAGEESGKFLVRDYRGDLETDIEQMVTRIRKDYPKYSYAMDSFECKLDSSGTVVTVRMKLHLSPQELLAIENRSYQSAIQRIYKALCDQVSAFTIQVSGYPEDTDLYALLDDYILHHPYEVVEAPQIFVDVFPKEGDTRVVALHFVYDTDGDNLSRHKSKADSFFNWTCANYFEPGQSAEEVVEILYNNLVPPRGYADSEKATVYTQVVEQNLCSSRTMASVVEYLCKRNGMVCEIVVGERGGERWYWNRILSGGQWRMFDLHAAALRQEAPALRLAAEMTGYSWDAERYPEIEEPEPAPPEETVPPSEAPAETAETAEAAEHTEPVETAQTPETEVPTEPAATGETAETEGTTEPAAPTQTEEP